MTYERHRLECSGVENCEGVSNIGVPGVHGGVVGVAVTSLVPAHNPPTGIGENGRQEIERPRKVETAVGSKQDRRIGRAPLNNSDRDTIAVDSALSIGTTCPRVTIGTGHAGVCANIWKGLVRSSTMPVSGG